MRGHDTLVIRICGDSGDGMQLIGQHLMMNAAMQGLEVRTLPDFPAEIRAPAGTVAGISGVQLAISTKRIETAGDKVDLLFALNPAALVHAQADLASQAFIYLNESQFSDRDWQKAKSDSNVLQSLRLSHQILAVPMTDNCVQALAAIDIKPSLAKKTKNFYTLGMLLWILELSLETANELIAKHFKTKPEFIQMNQMAITAGYHYGMTQDWQRPYFFQQALAAEPGEFRQMNGAQAVGLALATLASGLQTRVFVAGYPITPSSAILHEAAKLTDFGVDLFQAEDEIAAVCACLGAAYGGHLAITTTSGPGFDLKMEGLGLGVVSELPMVVLDVQRAGASTGLPTKTSQSDLLQAMYGRHGESPMPVLAAKSPSDCFYTVLEAFRLALEWMTPVVVLLDAYLMNASEPWKIPSPDELELPILTYYQYQEPFKRLANGARSWNPPGKLEYIHQLGGLEKQGDWGRVSYDANNHAQMNIMRAAKLVNMQDKCHIEDLDLNPSADHLLISWGSTYGVMKALVTDFKTHQQIPVSWLHLKHLNPFPAEVEQLIKTHAQVMVLELNSGQLTQLLRAKYLVDVKAIVQANGKPFSYEDLAEDLKQELL